MFDPAKRIVVESYVGLFDEELDELLIAVREKMKELDLPPHVKKTIYVRIDEDPQFNDEDSVDEFN